MESWIRKFNALYPRFLEALHAVSDVLMMLAQTLIVAFGVPLVLALLLAVEHERVTHGIELFEANPGAAANLGWALVLVNLVLEFTIHYIEGKADYRAENEARWSLRIWWKNTRYRLGHGDDWQSVALSPAQRYKKLLGVVTLTILLLALGGSMRTAIEQQPGAWHEGLIAVVTESKLIDMVTWTGGLLAAVAAVLTAQGLSRYVAMRCAEIALTMKEVQPPAEKPAPFGTTAPEQAESVSIKPIQSTNGLTANGNSKRKSVTK